MVNYAGVFLHRHGDWVAHCGYCKESFRFFRKSDDSHVIMLLCPTCKGLTKIEEFNALKGEDKMEELPKEYKPKVLRAREERAKPKLRLQTLYAVGYQQQQDEYSVGYGMVRGPVPDLETMLEIIPGEDDRSLLEPNKAKLFRLNRDGTDEILYVWCDDKWILNQEIKV